MSLMRKFVTFVTVVGVMVVGGGFASAGTDDKHSVTYQVVNTRSISLSNSGETIAIGTITKNDSGGITKAGGTVTYTTDSTSDKITAAITTGGNTEAGVTLSVSATNTTPGTGTNNGSEGTGVALSTAEASVITSINAISGAAASLEYKVVTDNTAVPGSLQTKEITYYIKATS